MCVVHIKGGEPYSYTLSTITLLLQKQLAEQETVLDPWRFYAGARMQKNPDADSQREPHLTEHVQVAK